jgi:hypothetical protein
MLSESQVRSVALFFLYAVLDEHAALPIADKTSAILKNKLSRVAEESIDAKRIFISTCKTQFDKIKKNLIRGQMSLTLSNALILPEDVSLAAWVRFHKESPDDELLAVIFSRIMGFTEHDIAGAMDVSEGTANYRLGRGLRRLGEIQRGMHRGVG